MPATSHMNLRSKRRGAGLASLSDAMRTQHILNVLLAVQNRRDLCGNGALRAQAALVRTLLDEVVRHSSRERVATVEAQLDDEVARLARMLEPTLVSRGEGSGVRKVALDSEPILAAS
jgi:hypothetical protein